MARKPTKADLEKKIKELEEWKEWALESAKEVAEERKSLLQELNVQKDRVRDLSDILDRETVYSQDALNALKQTFRVLGEVKSFKLLGKTVRIFSKQDEADLKVLEREPRELDY